MAGWLAKVSLLMPVRWVLVPVKRPGESDVADQPTTELPPLGELNPGGDDFSLDGSAQAGALAVGDGDEIRVGSPFRVDPKAISGTVIQRPRSQPETFYDVGPLRYTALGAVGAATMVLVFAAVAAWWFPGGRHHHRDSRLRTFDLWTLFPTADGSDGVPVAAFDAVHDQLQPGDRSLGSACEAYQIDCSLLGCVKSISPRSQASTNAGRLANMSFACRISVRFIQLDFRHLIGICHRIHIRRHVGQPPRQVCSPGSDATPATANRGHVDRQFFHHFANQGLLF